ncbi:MAG: phosphatase PAP2 family protein [Clostridia bacterium]|nr:phosphatase PAP2 family protein [Clostridia bacterium]
MNGNKVLQILFRACFLLLIPAIQIFYFILNNYSSKVRNISTVLDELIPFSQHFVIPYIYWYVYVFAVLVFFLFADYKYYYRLLACIISGTLICFIIYYFFPTTVPRPEVTGNDLFSSLVRGIYSNDNPYNCFPSIHVLDTILPTLFLLKYTKNKLVGAFAVISYIAITLSTLFIKQHYVWDAVSATILGLAMYFLYTNDYLWSKVPVKRISAYIRLIKMKRAPARN